MEENEKIYEEPVVQQDEVTVDEISGDEKAPVKKNPIQWVKENLVKAILALVAVVAVVIGLIVGLSIAGNNYKVPIKQLEKWDNIKHYTNGKYVSYYSGLANGLGNVDAIWKAAKKSENYEDNIADRVESLNDGVEDMIDQYGSNYKISYVIKEADPLEKSDLREYRDNLRESIKSLSEVVDESDDASSSDWEDFADELGMTKSDAKNFVKALGKYCDELKRLDVTAGYELTVIKTITGKELEEPIETELTYTVLKVNGRWVLNYGTSSALSAAMYLMY